MGREAVTCNHTQGLAAGGGCFGNKIKGCKHQASQSPVSSQAEPQHQSRTFTLTAEAGQPEQAQKTFWHGCSLGAQQFHQVPGAQGGPACTMNMNLWLLTCLVAVFVGAWVPTVCSQGVFEDCCLAYHQHTGRAMLRRARGYLLQEVSGSCNLPAVIFVLHHTDRMVCGNPRARWVRNGVKLLDARNRNLQKLQGAQRASQGP
ncbi:C-C motif chemokine 25 isoform X2 [Manis javanica]|uniref:C-C motif chemokine 25 isoform X2 n=1 Tax=Manis javanica TaxID=9974 RepID=UPI003C6D31FE